MERAQDLRKSNESIPAWTAREAGAKFNWKSSPVTGHPAAVDRPKENRWALYSSSSVNSQVDLLKGQETTEKGFLAEFEEELAKLRNEHPAPTTGGIQSNPSASDSLSSVQQNEKREGSASQLSPSSLTGPGAVLFEIVSALAGGLESLGNELTKKLPEIERKIANAQQDIPEAFRNTAADLLKAVEHPDQQSSRSNSQTGTERHEEARRPHSAASGAEDLFKGFGDLIKDIGGVGKAIFSGNDGRNNSMPVQEPSPTPTAPDTTEAPQRISRLEKDRSQALPGDSSLANVSKPCNSNARAEARASEGDHDDCVANCVIGPARLHEHCVTKEALGHDATDSQDSGKLSHTSHFRARAARHAVEGSQDLRSRSPSGTRREIPLNAKRSVNFVDQKGVINRQKALETLKRHRSVGSLHTKGKATSESSFPPKPRLLPRDNFNDNTNKQHTPALEDPHRSSASGADKSRAKTTLMHTDSLGDSRAILDQEDSDPDFSVRYPSLLSSRPSESSNTNMSRFNPSKSFLSDFNPEYEIARYPTVSQLHHQALNAQRPDNITLNHGIARKNVPLPPPLKIPGSWPQQEADHLAEESSGQFFERMTGLSSSNHLTRSNTVTASNPAARLPGPFDPLSDLAHTLREQKRRQAKTEDRTNAGASLIGRANTERVSSSRRPYSETFTGAGRVPWEAFVPIAKNHPQNAKAPFEHGPEQVTGARAPVPSRRDPWPAVRFDGGSQASHPIQAAQKDKYDHCVDRLKEMGYGMMDPVVHDRLRLFAVASEGNVEGAVDMLEEEREASRSLGKGQWDNGPI
ncbi:MAG: hypothetical protein Q9160_000274 [Pyrenula sp. 1 TL-2023]